MEDMQEILEDFLVEAFELVEQIDHDLVELETNPEDLELLNRIFPCSTHCKRLFKLFKF